MTDIIHAKKKSPFFKALCEGTVKTVYKNISTFRISN